MATNSVKQAYTFLDKAGTYFLATAEGEQPRVRPFGTILLFEDKLYFLTSKSKKVSKQLEVNPKFEISATLDQKWIRISGEVKADNRPEVHRALLDKYPHLKSSYEVGDSNTNALYLANVQGKIESFTDEAIELNF